VTARLVSCLMVTAGGAARWSRFVRSVDDYCRQTYGARELVVVADRMPDADFARLRDHARRLGRRDIRFVRPRAKLSLGALRNLSIDAARGELVCQWDDDDRHHPERLAIQCAALGDRGAVYLRDVMHYLEPLGVVYWVRWDVDFMPCHPATLLAVRRDLPRYPETGGESQRNEDRNLFLQLRQAELVSTLDGYPHLYTYVFHGSNTFALSHHLTFLRYTIPAGTLRRYGKRLVAELAHLRRNGTGVTLMSDAGPYAVLEARA
jgi:glycosyltransferase involved in cell wall biosynthesis